MNELSEQLLSKMADRSDKMIRNNNSLFTKRNIKKTIKNRRYYYDPLFWNNGVLSWALNSYRHVYRANEYFNNSKLVNMSFSPKMVDHFLFIYANYEEYDSKAINDFADIAMGLKRDSVGSILYRDVGQNVFLDSLGMVCAFLVRYGVEYEDNQAIEMAISQFDLMFRYGGDLESGLPYHGYNMASGYKCGIIGWSRGVGWMLLGIVECMQWLSPRSKDYLKLKRYFSSLIDVVMSYQQPEGGFSWQLQATGGRFDSSATAMIGYSVARYNKITKQKCHRSELSKIRSSILNSIDGSGTVLNSSAECQGFSMYPQVFESNSWGQGFALLMLVEMAIQDLASRNQMDLRLGD